MPGADWDRREIDWDQVPGTEIRFPHEMDGFERGVIQYQRHEDNSWVIQVRPGQRGLFRGEHQDWSGRWQRHDYRLDEPQKVIRFGTEQLVRWHEAGVIRLPVKPSLADDLAEALANADRGRRRVADPQPGDSTVDDRR